MEIPKTPTKLHWAAEPQSRYTPTGQEVLNIMLVKSKYIDYLSADTNFTHAIKTNNYQRGTEFRIGELMITETLTIPPNIVVEKLEVLQGCVTTYHPCTYTLTTKAAEVQICAYQYDDPEQANAANSGTDSDSLVETIGFEGNDSPSTEENIEYTASSIGFNPYDWNENSFDYF